MTYLGECPSGPELACEPHLPAGLIDRQVKDLSVSLSTGCVEPEPAISDIHIRSELYTLVVYSPSTEKSFIRKSGVVHTIELSEIGHGSTALVNDLLPIQPIGGKMTEMGSILLRHFIILARAVEDVIEGDVVAGEVATAGRGDTLTMPPTIPIIRVATGRDWVVGSRRREPRVMVVTLVMLLPTYLKRSSQKYE